VSLRDGVTYVAAVYLIVWLVIMAYMALLGSKVSRLEAELDRIEQAFGEQQGTGSGTAAAP
jgi:CcmD family protein